MSGKVDGDTKLNPVQFDKELDKFWLPLKSFLDKYPFVFRLDFNTPEGYILLSDLHYLTPLLDTATQPVE